MSQSIYEDTVEYVEEIVEVAYRGGSIEVNSTRGGYVAARIYAGGVWSIASASYTQRRPIKELKERARRNARRALTRMRGGERLSDAEFYTGEHSVGSEASEEELEDLVYRAVNLIEEGEVVATMYRRERAISGDWGRAKEKSVYYELLVYPVRWGARGTTVSAGVSIAFTGGVKDLTDRHLEIICREAKEIVNAKLKAKVLSPMLRGRTTVILEPEPSAAFFHELSHMLEGDRRDCIPKGQRISTRQLSIYDDPHFSWSPSYTMFDDEAVKTRRKALVEDGEVYERLHTRESASKTIEEGPGNARGLFHRPKAMHTTLVVHPGDWRREEIVEETRNGILVRGVVKAELVEGSVIITPEIAWIIKDGEVQEPVRLREVIIPIFTGLTRLSAMGRDPRLRHSYEKGHVVAEVAPTIRTEAYVQ